jgi:hypothetical protein
MDFETVLTWAKTLNVPASPPPTDDEYPDWEDEVRVAVAAGMGTKR